MSLDARSAVGRPAASGLRSLFSGSLQDKSNERIHCLACGKSFAASYKHTTSKLREHVTKCPSLPEEVRREHGVDASAPKRKHPKLDASVEPMVEPPAREPPPKVNRSAHADRVRTGSELAAVAFASHAPTAFLANERLGRWFRQIKPSGELAVARYSALDDMLADLDRALTDRMRFMTPTFILVYGVGLPFSEVHIAVQVAAELHFCIALGPAYQSIEMLLPVIRRVMEEWRHRGCWILGAVTDCPDLNAILSSEPGLELATVRCAADVINDALQAFLSLSVPATFLQHCCEVVHATRTPLVTKELYALLGDTTRAAAFAVQLEGDSSPHNPRRLVLPGPTRWATHWRMIRHLMENAVVLRQISYAFPEPVQTLIKSDEFWGNLQAYDAMLYPFIEVLERIRRSSLPAASWTSTLEGLVRKMSEAAFPDGIVAADIGVLLSKLQRDPPFCLWDLAAVFDPAQPPPDPVTAEQALAFVQRYVPFTDPVKATAVLHSLGSWCMQRDSMYTPPTSASWVPPGYVPSDWWRFSATRPDVAVLRDLALAVLAMPVSAASAGDAYFSTRKSNAPVLLATTGRVEIGMMSTITRLTSFFENFVLSYRLATVNTPPVTGRLWYQSHACDTSNASVDDCVNDPRELDLDSDLVCVPFRHPVFTLPTPPLPADPDDGPALVGLDDPLAASIMAAATSSV